VLRRMAGRMQGLDLDITEVENIAFVHAEEVISGSGTRVEDVPGSHEFGELAPTGNVVGMNVGINDVADLQAVLLGYPQVGFGITNSVAHGGQALSPSTENIRGGDDGIGAQYLPEYHCDLLAIVALRIGSVPLTSGNPRARQS
jgi:hypothetical protein